MRKQSISGGWRLLNVSGYRKYHAKKINLSSIMILNYKFYLQVKNIGNFNTFFDGKRSFL